MRKTKQKESSQSNPSTRVMILSLRAYNPESPHKIILANTGPGDFDWPTHLSPDGDVGKVLPVLTGKGFRKDSGLSATSSRGGQVANRCTFE